MKFLKLLVILLSSNIVIAQNIHIGPEIGMNIIKVETPQIGNNYQPSWHAGLNFKYDFNNWLAINTGVYYTQKRQSYSSADTTLFPLIGLLGLSDVNGIDFNTYSQTTGRHTQNFIQIPIMASFKYEDFSLNMGGYIGFQFSSRTKELEVSNTPFVSVIDLSTIDQSGFTTFFLPPPSEETYTESSNNSSLRTLDYGLKIGASYTMENLSLNAHYLYGFADYRLSQGENPKQVHQYFQISLSYLFGFGKEHNKNHSRFQ